MTLTWKCLVVAAYVATQLLWVGSSRVNAWQFDRFRSGMSYDEVLAMWGCRVQDRVRVPLEIHPRSYVLQCKTPKDPLHFSFCFDVLYEISVDLSGGLSEFGRTVEAERKNSGDPHVRVVHNPRGLPYTLIYAEWKQGHEVIEVILQSDYDRNVSLGKSYKDTSISKRCN